MENENELTKTQFLKPLNLYENSYEQVNTMNL